MILFLVTLIDTAARLQWFGVDAAGKSQIEAWLESPERAAWLYAWFEVKP